MAFPAGFSLKSNRSKMILFALVFAVIGGVYYLYSTHAASISSKSRIVILDYGTVEGIGTQPKLVSNSNDIWGIPSVSNQANGQTPIFTYINPTGTATWLTFGKTAFKRACFIVNVAPSKTAVNTTFKLNTGYATAQDTLAPSNYFTRECIDASAYNPSVTVISGSALRVYHIELYL